MEDDVISIMSPEYSNSPYTEALLYYMKEPGLTIEQVFKGVRAKLGKDTGGKQIP